MEQAIQEILKALKDPDPEIRLHAVEKLAQSKDPKNTAHLIDLMGDPEWRVRKSAVVAVTGLERNPQLVEELIRVLDQEGNVGKRNAAEEALIHIGKFGLPPLLAHLPKANKDVKKMIIEIVGEIGDKQATPDLIRMLGDPDENVKMAAIESLGKIRDVRSIEALTPLLQSENTLISFITVKALERIGDERALDPILRIVNKKGVERVALEALGTFSSPAVLDPVLTALQTGSEKIKESALKALVDHHEKVPSPRQAAIVERVRRGYDKNIAGFLNGALELSDEKIRPSAVRVLGWVMEASAAKRIAQLVDGDVREDAMAALIRMGPAAVDPLLQELATAAETAREGIVRILGEIGDRRSVPALIGLLHDPNGHVRQTAALALGRIQDPSSAEALLDLLSDEYASVQEAATQALCLLKNTDCISRLMELLRSDKTVLRGNAVKVLGKMKAAESVPRLSFCLKDEDPAVRKSAVEALSEFDGAEVAGPLVLALADEDRTVRLAALMAIFRHPEIDFMKQIGPLLRDESIWVRATVARGLGERRDDAGKKILTAMLKDPVGVVQIAAIEALGRFKDRHLALPIFEMTAGRDSEVVKSAITVLGEIGDRGIAQRLHVFLTHGNWGIRAAAAQAVGKLRDATAKELFEKMVRDDPDRLVRQSAEYALSQLAEQS